MNALPFEVWQAVSLSLKVAFCATVLMIPLALWVAHLLARGQFRGRVLLSAMVHLPLVLPPVVTGYFLLLAFGTQGAIGAALARFGIVLAFNWTGAVLAAAVMGFPLMVRAFQQAIEAVDPAIEEAAATLGAPRFARFRLVTFPLMRNGVIAGCVLAFAKALGEFGATITFVAAIPGQTQTIPSAIYAFLQVPDAQGTVAWLVGISCALAIGAVITSEWLIRRGQVAK